MKQRYSAKPAIFGLEYKVSSESSVSFYSEELETEMITECEENEI